MNSWLAKFPGIPRDIQTELIQSLQANWELFDVFAISLGTGCGKTYISKCLMDNLYNVSYLAPNNLLIDQYLANFPDEAVLKRMDSYWCETWAQPCSATRGKYKGFCARDLRCSGCEAVKKAISAAKYRNGPIVSNYHIFESYKLNREVLIFDEGHNILPIIKSFLGKTLWQHDLKYPDQMYSQAYMLKWLESQPKEKLAKGKLKLLYNNLISKEPEYIIHRTTKPFNGKGTRRGEPQDRDCLELQPVYITGDNIPKYFWNRGAKKLIILSATIGRKDIEELDLHSSFSKRVLYMECKSPIPPENRALHFIPTTSVTHANLAQAADKLAIQIEKLAQKHINEKGVVHATYQLAKLLRERLGSNPRYLFHTGETKAKIYAQFRESTEPKILVASGMYEGIDLPEDLGRWQVISKIPWPSLGNPAIKYKMERDEEWYYWETMKSVIQACGRICRSEQDWGINYVLDITWKRLYINCVRLDLLPKWFSESIMENEK